MTHPPNVCAHCENGRDPVKKNNGFVFEFQIVDGVLMEICLHDGCVEPWCRAFGILSPLRDLSLSREGHPNLIFERAKMQSDFVANKANQAV